MREKRTSLLVAIVALVVAVPRVTCGSCTTTVPAGTMSGATWSIAGSPYCIGGDILVDSLTVEPGVLVQFLGEYELYVTGTLTAAGTGAQPILFRKDSLNPTGWKGMVFDYANSASRLVHCTVENATNTGVTIINTILTVDHCAFSNNQGGNGGGVKVDLSTATGQLVLTECVISGNNATGHGGGIYANVSAGSLLLEGCMVTNNTTNAASAARDSFGGGIYLESATGGVAMTRGEAGCVISGNDTFSLCDSLECTTYGKGGGIYVAAGDLDLSSCVVSGNSARSHAATSWGHSIAHGGGVYLVAGSVLLTNSIVGSNTVEGVGGSNGYPSQERGGGLYLQGGAIGLFNSDLVDNLENGAYREAGVLSADNSIVYGNSGTQIVGVADLHYCDVQGGWPGVGNFDLSPGFVNSPADYHLLATSPCIDAGDPAAVGLPATDMDGQPRVHNGLVDLGPYEFTTALFADGFESSDTSEWSWTTP